MRYVFAILALLFGALHAVAALSALLKKSGGITHPMMLLGAALVVEGGILCLMGNPLDWVISLGGSVIVLAAALMNGRNSGQLHLPHHLIRGAVALVFVLGMVFF